MNDLCLWEHTVDGCSQWNYGKSIYIFIHNITNGDLSVCPQIVTGPHDFNVTIERCPHYAIKRAHTHTHNNSCTLERRVAPVGSECEIELCRTVPVRVWDQSQAFESTDTEMDRQHVCVCVYVFSSSVRNSLWTGSVPAVEARVTCPLCGLSVAAVSFIGVLVIYIRGMIMNRRLTLL